MKEYYYNLDEDKLERNENLNLEDFLINLGKEDKLYVSIKMTNLGKLKHFAQKLNKASSDVIIELDCEKSYIEDDKELDKLKETNSFCESKNYKLNLKLQNAIGNSSYENFAIAKQKIDEFVNNFNNFVERKKKEGYDLSVIEKYFIVYKFVANRVYKEDVNFLNDEMRSWIGVLSSDNVICSGFASLLKCVCDRVFDPEEIKCYEQSCEVFDDDGKKYGSHALNIVRIKDKKYNIDGLYNSDSCWGAKCEENYMQGSYEYCLNPLSVYGMMKNTKFKFRDNLTVYDNIENVNVESLKLEDLSWYKEHELTTDLLSEMRLKSFEELKNSVSIDEKLKARKQEIDTHNQLVTQKSEQDTNEFLLKNELDDYVSTIFPTIYNKSIKEEYPILKDFQIFCNAKGNMGEDNIKMLKKVCALYKSNPEIFDSIKKDIALHFGGEDAFSDSLYNILKDKLANKKLIFNEIEETKSLNENLYKEYLQEQGKLKDKATCLINSQKIPLKAIKSGLRMVAEFSGMSDKKVENYIEGELEKIKKFKSTLNLNENAFKSLNTP